MLRAEVFVVEQNCVFNDLDNFDEDALHLLGYVDLNSEFASDKQKRTKLVAYARTYGPNNKHVHARDKPECSIGRVITDKDYRSLGYGKELMNEAIKWCIESYPTASIRIGAQVYLSKFYSELGFVNDGDPYDEDGIPHHDMVFSKHQISQEKE